MDDYPKADRDARSRRAGAAPDPRRARRRGRLRHHDGAVRLGVAELSRSTTSRSATCSPTLLVDEQHSAAARAAGRRGGTGCGPATSPGRPRPGSTPMTPGTGSPAPCGSTGTRSTPGSRRTRRSSSTPATPTRASTRCGPPAPSGSSSTAIVLAESSSPVHGLRDRPADPLLLQPHRGELRRTCCRPTPSRRCPYKGTTSGYWSVRVGRRPCSRTWPGPTTSPPGSCCRSPA